MAPATALGCESVREGERGKRRQRAHRREFEARRCRRADRVVLPGVGAYADCKRGLEAVPGLRDALETRVRRDGVPFLGICVGMQLMGRAGMSSK